MLTQNLVLAHLWLDLHPGLVSALYFRGPSQILSTESLSTLFGTGVWKFVDIFWLIWSSAHVQYLWLRHLHASQKASKNNTSAIYLEPIEACFD